MADTAQALAPAETDPNAQIQNAVDAFKAFDNPSAAQPRGEDGKWVKTGSGQPDEDEAGAEDEDEPEAQAEGEPEDEAEGDEDAEAGAADEAQPLPPSWGADDQELWNSLPPEARAKIAEREGERDRGLNLKLQENALATKAAKAKADEFSTKLDDLTRVIGTVEALYKTPEPDARAFGYGTVQFNEAAYIAAHQQWQQTENVLAQLNEQRETARKEASEAEAAQYSEWLNGHNAEFAPQFVELAPDLKDNAKAASVFNSVFDYAKKHGVDPAMFEGDRVKEIPLGHVLAYYKAMKFDELRAAKAPAKPKPAGPAVKPGVSSPRSAQKAARQQKAFDRLAREGSIEAGAAVFRNFFG